MTGFTGNPRFVEGIFFKIDAGGMASAAFQQPGPFIPVFFVVINPAISIRIVLNRRDKECVVFIYQETLFLLAADGVKDLIFFGNVNLIRRHLEFIA